VFASAADASLLNNKKLPANKIPANKLFFIYIASLTEYASIITYIPNYTYFLLLFRICYNIKVF